MSPAACPACGSPRSRRTIAVREFGFRRCGSCATLFCVQAPPQEGPPAFYGGQAYFENPDFGAPGSGGYHGYKDYMADRAYIEGKFAGILDHLARLRPRGDLLDVGCGPGFLLNVARDHGWRTVGLDLNPWAASYAREQFGLDVRTSTIQDARLPDAAFDAVTLMDLIEHTDDPEGLVAEVARVTRPGAALAIITPDAGSPVSRALGARWPELQRAPEHLVLFSARGLGALLERHGFRVHGWHSMGKESDLATIIADVSPAAPAVGQGLAALARIARVDGRVVDLDPHTKLCLYATRTAGYAPAADRHSVVHLPTPHVQRPTPEEAVFEDLQALAQARRFTDWMFAQYRDAVRGRVVEVGAGIGTYSALTLAAGAEELLLLEPEDACAAELERRFAHDPRVVVSRDTLPDAPALAQRAGTADLIVCQNVLEHISDDVDAVAAMARALAPGGQLTLIVPAHPRLFGSLDVVYGHHRRYTPTSVRFVLERAGLQPTTVKPFNALGILGWLLKNRRPDPQIGAGSMRAYEELVRLWRPLEDRLRLPVGLSLVAHAHRPR